MQWKAADLSAIRRVFRTPPGSETRACSQRGSSGTWESQLSPCKECGIRGAVPWRINPRRCIGPRPALSESYDMSKRHKTKEARKVSGEDSEERTNLRRAFGSLSGT